MRKNIKTKTAKYSELIHKYAFDEDFNEFIDLVLFMYKCNQLENASNGVEQVYNNPFDMIVRQINALQLTIGGEEING